MNGRLESCKQTVLVTGFGPFDNHVVNASWEAVKELDKLWADSKEVQDILLITKELPVLYNYVSNEVSELWKTYTPTLVIHVGVSHKAKLLTLEHHACSTGYIRPDIIGRCPDETNVSSCTIKTQIDIKTICDNLNKCVNANECKFCVSYDAGRYLCEYVFYQSLCIQPERVIFIHVPDFDEYSSMQTAKGLYDIILHVIKNKIKNSNSGQ